MKLYLAGAHSDKMRLKEIAVTIAGYGYEITSQWLDEPTRELALGTWSGDPWRDRETAARDVEDVRRADGIVLDTLTPSTTGGYDTEWGIAMTRMMRLRVVVGPYRNGFQRYGAQFQFLDWETALRWLRR